MCNKLSINTSSHICDDVFIGKNYAYFDHQSLEISYCLKTVIDTVAYLILAKWQVKLKKQ